MGRPWPAGSPAPRLLALLLRPSDDLLFAGRDFTLCARNAQHFRPDGQIAKSRVDLVETLARVWLALPLPAGSTGLMCREFPPRTGR